MRRAIMIDTPRNRLMAASALTEADGVTVEIEAAPREPEVILDLEERAAPGEGDGLTDRQRRKSRRTMGRKRRLFRA